MTNKYVKIRLTQADTEAIMRQVHEAAQGAIIPLIAQLTSLNDQLGAVCRDYQKFADKMATKKRKRP